METPRGHGLSCCSIIQPVSARVGLVSIACSSSTPFPAPLHIASLPSHTRICDPSTFPGSGRTSPALGNLVSPLGTVVTPFLLLSYFLWRPPARYSLGLPPLLLRCSLENWAFYLVSVLLIQGSVQTRLLSATTEDSGYAWPRFAVHRHLF